MGTENTETADIVKCNNSQQNQRCNRHQNNLPNSLTICQNNCSTENRNGQHINSINSDSKNDVKILQIEIDENNIIDGAKEILKVIRSNWNLDNVKFKLFTDGITNKLVGCFYSSDPSLTSKNCNKNDCKITQTNRYEDVVLVRIYGRKTDMLIDRKAETRNIKILHQYNLSPTLFATFKNGLAYEFIPGVTLTPESIVQPKIWQLIASRMAEMHKVEINNVDRIPMLWSKTQKFLDLVPDKFTDDIKQERISKLFPPNAKLRDDFKKLYNQLEKLNSPIVFAHNDLLLGNVIYTESQNRVMFIDYEYAAYNYQGFDIGNHFTEFAGIDEIDYTRYPNKEFQLKWLRIYLETFLNKKNIDEKDIERLYVQVNQFALASHYFWAVWALIQAEHSTIEFDFVQFAQMRYGEYLAKKDQFLALKL